MCKGTCTIACNTNILTERITLLIVGLTLEQITPQTIPLGGNILFGIGGVIVHGFGSKQFGTPKKDHSTPYPGALQWESGQCNAKAWREFNPLCFNKLHLVCPWENTMLEGMHGVQFDNGAMGWGITSNLLPITLRERESLQRIFFACHLGSTSIPIHPCLCRGCKVNWYTSQAKNDPFSLSKEGAMLCKRVLQSFQGQRVPCSYLLTAWMVPNGYNQMEWNKGNTFCAFNLQSPFLAQSWRVKG